MDGFVPDIYQKSIFTIDYKALKKKGIKCILFDLDNTIAQISMPVPSSKVKDLFAYLEGLKFKIIILSNARKSIVAPFKEMLNVDASYRSFKPSKKKYEKILKTYHFQVHEIVAVGDELLTDIWGANRMGFTSILVNPISNKDNFISRFLRFFEQKIYLKLKKKGILEKGVYYE